MATPKKTKAPPLSLAERQRVVQQNFLARQRAGAKEAESPTAFSQGMVYIPCIYQQYALGWAGYALGKILQIGGMYGAGKSSRMMYLARQFYEAGGLVYPVDIEHAMHMGLISAYMGPYADMFDLAISRPDGLESGFVEVKEILDKKMRQDDPEDIVPKLILFDTLGGASKDGEEIGDTRQVGGSSPLVTSFVNAVVPALSSSRCLLCLGNQIRDKMDIGAGPAASNQPWYKKLKLPGGHGLEHASYWIEFMRQMKIHKDKDDPVRANGHVAEVVMVKNKADAPYRFYSSDIFYSDRGMDFTEHGLNWLYSSNRAGVERKKSKAYVYWSDLLGIPESGAMEAEPFYKAVNSVEIAPILHGIFGIKFPRANLYLPNSHEGLQYTPWDPSPEQPGNRQPRPEACEESGEAVPEPEEG